MDDQAQKKLRGVTFLLFSTVLIISAGWITYMYIWVAAARAAAGTPASESPIGAIFAASWWVVLIAAVTAAALWAAYRYWILPRQTR